VTKGLKNAAIILLENGADVNTPDKDGYTALMWASRYCHESTVRLLLDHGADKELKNEHGESAIDLAKTEDIKAFIQKSLMINGIISLNKIMKVKKILYQIYHSL
jgi:ankyrin repeat protein